MSSPPPKNFPLIKTRGTDLKRFQDYIRLEGGSRIGKPTIISYLKDILNGGILGFCEGRISKYIIPDIWFYKRKQTFHQ